LTVKLTNLVMIVLLLGMGATAHAEPAKWARFTPPGSSFSITMPGQPRQVENGPSTWLWMSGVQDEFVYFVSYGVVPDMADSDQDLMLTTFTTAFLAGAKVTEKRRRSLTWKTLLCLEIEGEKGGRPFFARTIASPKENRIYSLAVNGETAPASRSRFWNGFSIK
jgi:hypothetical protein